MNNKGYVLAPLIVLFFVLVTILVYSFRQSFVGQVNRASEVMGVMDRFSFDNDKRVLSFVDSFKQGAYGNLSNASLYSSFISRYGVLVVDYPVFVINIPGFNYSSSSVNASFGSVQSSVVINYPLASVLSVSSVIQSRINSLREVSCDGFMINGYVVEPLSFCSCNQLVDFVVLNRSGGMTLLYPFRAGKFSVPCIE